MKLNRKKAHSEERCNVITIQIFPEELKKKSTKKVKVCILFYIKCQCNNKKEIAYCYYSCIKLRNKSYHYKFFPPLIISILSLLFRSNTTFNKLTLLEIMLIYKSVQEMVSFFILHWL